MESTDAATDDLTRSIDQQMARAEATVVKARAYADQVARLRGRGSYRGVHVVVEAAGMPTEFRFDDSTRGAEPAMLAHACQIALRAACADVHAAARAACIETWGADDPIVQASLDEMAGRFGAGVA